MDDLPLTLGYHIYRAWLISFLSPHTIISGIFVIFLSLFSSSSFFSHRARRSGFTCSIRGQFACSVNVDAWKGMEVWTGRAGRWGDGGVSSRANEGMDGLMAAGGVDSFFVLNERGGWVDLLRNKNNGNSGKIWVKNSISMVFRICRSMEYKSVRNIGSIKYELMDLPNVK